MRKDLLSAYSKTKWEEGIASQIMPKSTPVVFNINKLNVIPHVYVEHYTPTSDIWQQTHISAL